MFEKLEGIIISEIDYKESSKIINIFTKKYGIIGVLARGAKRLKSNFTGVTTKLTYGYFYLNFKEKGLSILKEVEVINPLKNIRKSLTLISYASYLTELVSQVYRHENNINIYDLYINALLKLEDNKDPMVITNIIELKLLDYLGISPNLNSCISCNNTNIVTISSYKGGLLCNKCKENEKIVHPKTIKLIRIFYYVDISKIDKIEVSINIKNEINDFIDDYYERYSGLYLKSKEFLKKFLQI